MRAKKRIQLKRKPLSDCTNDVVAASPKNANPLQPKSSGIGRCEVSEPSTVYTRRRRRSAEESEQGNAVCFPLSKDSSLICTRNIGEQEEAADGDMGLSKLQNVLQRKKPKQALHEQDASEDCLNGYLEKQRVYFEAVDAEELKEEVETDKEDSCTEGIVVYNLGEVKA